MSRYRGRALRFRKTTTVLLMHGESGSPTLFLVGAGFSRAISAEMPLLKDLGLAVAQRFVADSYLSGLLSPAERRAIDEGRIPLGNVEVWLTSLAASQPFLSEARNLARRALFLELSALIANEIETRRRLACEQPMPTWLVRLLALWHHCQSQVLTFNYDILIETAVAGLKLVDPEGGLVRPDHVFRSFPPEVPEMGRFGEETRATFSLTKLHGSTNWFGHDAGADVYSVVRADALVPNWGAEVNALRAAPMALIERLRPMILPPVADKSLMYGNASVSLLWRRAASAVAQAERIVLFGYSLPPTDTSTMAMLSESIRPETVMTVVDARPGPVTDSLGLLGLDNVEQIDALNSDEVSRLLSDLEVDARRRLDVSKVLSGHEHAYVEVRAPSGTAWSIEAVVSDIEGRPELLAAHEPRDLTAAQVNPSGVTIDLSDVASIVQSVRFPDARQAVPLGIRVSRQGPGDSAVTIDISEPVGMRGPLSFSSS